VQVVAIHRISDPDGFDAAVARAMESALPEGYDLRFQVTSADRRTQVCLWEAPSVQAVREIVDGTVGEYADNEVFEGEVNRAAVG
jgi:hypothetical protein